MSVRQSVFTNMAIALLALPVLHGSPAMAACAVQEATATGNNLQQATRRAIRAGQNAARQYGASNAEISEPMCLYLDDGSNRVRCTVTASFCTTPPVAAPAPLPVPGPAPVPRGGGNCGDFRATATAGSLQQAQSSVTQTLAQAVRSQTGLSLSDGRVTAMQPACYYLDNGSNQAHCEQTARVCR